MGDAGCLGRCAVCLFGLVGREVELLFKALAGLSNLGILKGHLAGWIKLLDQRSTLLVEALQYRIAGDILVCDLSASLIGDLLCQEGDLGVDIFLGLLKPAILGGLGGREERVDDDLLLRRTLRDKLLVVSQGVLSLNLKRPGGVSVPLGVREGRLLRKLLDTLRHLRHVLDGVLLGLTLLGELDSGIMLQVFRGVGPSDYLLGCLRLSRGAN